MLENRLSRRQFLGTSALGATGGCRPAGEPGPRGRSSRRSQGRRSARSDDQGGQGLRSEPGAHAGGPTNQGYTQIASIVTNSRPRGQLHAREPLLASELE